MPVMSAAVFQCYPRLSSMPVMSAPVFQCNPGRRIMPVLSAAVFQCYPRLSSMPVMSAPVFQCYPGRSSRHACYVCRCVSVLSPGSTMRDLSVEYARNLRVAGFC